MMILNSMNKKSFASYLLLPQIGPRLNSFFSQGFSNITYIIALILSSVRLLEKSHPVFSNAKNNNTSIRKVLGEASVNLTFDLKHIDQIIVFFALIAGIIILFLQLLLIFVFIMNGTAFAQELPNSYADFLETSGNTDDIALQMMAYVFGLPEFFGVTGISENAFHTGLRGIFQFYSIGLLAIAVIILIYFVFAILAETAQTGTPFGKRYNHVWAPIRLVVAIGLLVPISQGLNSAQWITLHAAKYGSGFATNGWNKFNETLSDTYIPTEELIARPNIQETNFREMASFFMMAHACKRAYEVGLGTGGWGDEIDAYLIKSSDGGQSLKLTGTSYFQALDFAGEEKALRIRIGRQNSTYAQEVSNVKPHCGEITYILPGPGRDSSTSIGSGANWIIRTYYRIMEDMWNGRGAYSVLRTEAHKMIEARLERGSGSESFDPNPEIRETVPAAVRQDLESALDTAIRTTVEDFSSLDSIEYERYGWGGAGLWYNNIAGLNGVITYAALNKPQIVEVPRIMKYVCDENRQQNKQTSIKNCYNPDLAEGLEIQKTDNLPKTAMKALSDVHDFWYQDSGKTTNNFFIDTINLILGTNALFDMCANADVHPLAQLSTLGKGLVDSSIRNMGFGILGGLGSIFAGQFGPALSAASSAASTIGGITILLGFILFYIVPFLPFLYFFFAVGGWVKGVFEAMVGVPLWALAHIRIDGEGLPGDAASSGYFLIFEIFIRPILIVFGLVASLLIFSAMIKVLNDIFYLVVSNLSGFDSENIDLCGNNVGGSSTPSANSIDYFRGPVDAFFFTIVYAIIVYIMGMSSFKLIDLIPNQILRWMGQNAATFNDSSDEPGQDLVKKVAIGGTLLGQVTGEVGGNAKKAVTHGIKASGNSS